MTVDARVEEVTAPAGPAAPSFSDLVGDADAFFRDHWAARPAVFRARTDLTPLLSRADITTALDEGLLAAPYVALFDGRAENQPVFPLGRRHVAGVEVADYVDADLVARKLAAGATCKLNRIDHWHEPAERLTEEFAAIFRGSAVAHAFLSPPGREVTIRPHLDGSHVFILQLSGEKDWIVAELSEDSTSDSAFCADDALADVPKLETRLRPGDVLYLPHGCAHAALARTSTSLHIAVEVHEPSARELTDVYLATFMTGPAFRTLVEASAPRRPAALAADVVKELASFLREADSAAVFDAAVDRKKRGA